MKWISSSFDELTKQQWYDIVKLRQDVFIVEQDCPYPDVDGKDPLVRHLMAYIGSDLVAYTRLIPLSLSFDGALSIGRVVVHPSARGSGLSLELMKRSIDEVYNRYGTQDIVIGAQAHLEGMYSKLGFAVCSEEYLEDGIPHVDMILKTPNARSLVSRSVQS